MTTLTMNMGIYTVGLSLKGLCFKAVSMGHKLKSDLCRMDDGKYGLYLQHHHIDSKTAKIKSDLLIMYLKELYECIPFDKIKIKGHYELTGDELMERINNQ